MGAGFFAVLWSDNMSGRGEKQLLEFHRALGECGSLLKIEQVNVQAEITAIGHYMLRFRVENGRWECL